MTLVVDNVIASRLYDVIFPENAGELSLVDVGELEDQEKNLVLEKLVNAVNEDTKLFFDRIRQRFNAVDLEFPKVEVRFQDLSVDAFVHVGSRALPTVPNFIFNMTDLRLLPGRRKKLSILYNINGIIRPSRLMLLLGRSSSGKTTLLLALAGRLGPGLQDLHMAEMTVRETLEFSWRCQGVGFKHEKQIRRIPDADLDIFIKALALGEQKTNLAVVYTMKILGLDI